MTTVPAPLIEFFQQEASEYLERIDQLLATADQAPPDTAAFVAQTRALRGSAMMTRLDGLTDLAATVERIANGLRSGELRWDQRLLFAVRGALVELKALVALAPRWSEAEQRRSRTQSVALAAVAAGYLAGASLPNLSPGSPVVPISRLLMTDGSPGILHRNPEPAITIAQRFRGDIAAAADGVGREAAALTHTAPGGTQLAVGDGVRRALLGLADVAESYGATSISGLATKMARANLDNPASRAAIQGFARLLMDRELSDQELAAQVKSASASWNVAHGTPSSAVVQQATPSAPFAPPRSADTTPIVPIEQLSFRGAAALRESKAVAQRIRDAIHDETTPRHQLAEMLGELVELLGLAELS